MGTFEYLSWDLSKVDYLSFTTFLVHFVLFVMEAVAVVLVGEVVVDIKVVDSLFPLLPLSKDEVYPARDLARHLVAL